MAAEAGCLEVSSAVGRVPTRGFAATGISTRASPALRVRSARVCQRRVCLEVSSVVGRVPTRGFCGDRNIYAGFTRPTGAFLMAAEAAGVS
jgi:hypothetical protein